jgi:mycothiol synthase
MKNTDQITLKNAPKIPGLRFRKFRGEADIEAMAAIINAANKADGDDALASAQDIANTYAHLQRSDSDKDMLMVEFEDQLVGYGRCEWAKELNGDHLYTFFINLHPDFRRDGIPLAMIEFLRERLVVIAAQHPADAPKYYQTWGLKGMAWYEELMDRLGLKPVRYEFRMIRPASQPVEVTPLPDGIEVRPVQPEDYRKVFDATYEAFQDHWGYVEPTEKNYQRWLHDSVFDPSIWKVAWEGDQVVGMVLNFMDPEEDAAFNRKRGYTEDISVRRPWRRQGVARGLLTQSIKMFQEMGSTDTCLSVDTENPNGALKLYQSVGYQEYNCNLTYRAPIELENQNESGLSEDRQE